MESSYKQNNYGEVFRAIISAFHPINAVELGVLNGYSTFHIAAALKKNGRGDLNAYDLFEDYPYRHSNYEDIKILFQHCQNVKIHKQDAYSVADNYQNGSVDFLHIDLSNDGDTVKKIMNQWDTKMVIGGIILFEGGTEERDKVEWMMKYNRPSLKNEIETNKFIENGYILGTYLKYPGLTMLLKKRDQ